jgi:N-acetylglucosaminyl-diphospho-decaprenol L-rhamnosyltransferase
MDKLNKIAIIIPIHNRIDVTQKGIWYLQQSIAYYEKYSNNQYKLCTIIVDDGSTDGSSAWIKNKYPEIVILYGDGSLWWTGAINMGIRYAIDTYSDLKGVILNNDDIKIKEEWLMNMISDVDRLPNSLIGCVTVDSNDGCTVTFGGINRKGYTAFSSGFEGRNINEFPKNHIEESSALYGRGIYIPKEVFLKIGLFNQHRFKHRGDADIPIRAKKAGYRLFVSFSAIIYEMSELTYNLDRESKIKLKDFKKVFFDIRSTSYYKYIFYYALISSKNMFHFMCYFTTSLAHHIKSFVKKIIAS